MFHRHLAISIEITMKYITEFEKELKKVLENEICINQSLDNPADRKRVKKEIMKMFEKDFCCITNPEREQREVNALLYPKTKENGKCPECGSKIDNKYNFCTNEKCKSIT